MLNDFYAKLLKSGRKDGAGLSTRTTRYIHTILRRALKDAVRWGRVARNVADLADPQRERKSSEMKVWLADQVRGFLSHVREDRFYALLLLALTTGLRRGELLGLRWSDVDVDAGKLCVNQSLVTTDYRMHFSEPKTARGRRTITLDPATVAALRSWRARQLEERLSWGPAWTDSGLVFTREDGSPIHPQSISDSFERLAKAAGLPKIRFHDLRHTYATLALESGMKPWDLADRLGHATPAFTLHVYRHAV